MLKVLIVDDEYYFRQALKVSLPWNDLGFEICGEAKNGKEALEKIHETNPDIALVDINMPVMDGLEFIKCIREQGNELKIVILTGQSEFTYAKQAVQLGTYNYILKPIDENEIKNTLFEIKGLIESEQSIKLEMDDLRRQVREYMPVLRDRFLNEILQGNLPFDSNELVQKMEYLNMTLISPYYLSVVIEIDRNEELQWLENELEIWKFAVSNIAADMVLGKCEYAICHDHNDCICVVLGFMDSESFDTIEALCDGIRHAVHKYLKFTVTIGIGNIYKDIADVSISYKEALFALKNRLILGGNRVILHNMVSEIRIMGTLFSVEQRSQLLMSMRIGNAMETEKRLTDIFTLIRSKNVNVDMLFVTSVEMVSTCLEYLTETGQSIKEVFMDTDHLLTAIQDMNSIDQIENWIKDIFANAVQHVQKNKYSKSAKVVEDVKNYIQRHYFNEELKIDDIAKHVYTNYSHLCFVFKKETGITINDFLTEVRMYKAKELFDNGDQLIQIVANKVGYADANYFGKCFKKYFGMPPSKYIENIKW
ncbi:response regulator transcription factor [Cohnella silvisoli]|uniref:Response regulator n=1 Tax=Cohnella silvisoli TaxID=2873699 RepID=A0ABV1KVG9_9BACL|nr:response regulator [Cohnella silvisoli]MCD9023503.1 response regulator [Cohnella silvisoli]